MTEALFIESQKVGSVGVAEDGTYPVTILTPGLGATAYYSETVIARDAPKAFPKGTHVYLTHQRGEGGEPDPDRLLGSLVNDTTIRESDGAAVNRFKPLRRHADFIEDVHQLVGLSIAARGSSTMGTIDGKQVRIAESIDYSIANTVDVVSYPGRKGSGFVESAFAKSVEEVQPEASATGNQEEGVNMTEVEKQVADLATGLSKLTTLVESIVPAAPAAEEVDAKADRAKAVAAARLVESAEVSEDLKTQLIEGINEGNYEVEAAIASHTKLRESIREELKTEFAESAVAGAAGAAGTANVTVNGWG